MNWAQGLAIMTMAMGAVVTAVVRKDGTFAWFLFAALIVAVA